MPGGSFGAGVGQAGLVQGGEGVVPVPLGAVVEIPGLPAGAGQGLFLLRGGGAAGGDVELADELAYLVVSGGEERLDLRVEAGDLEAAPALAIGGPGQLVAELLQVMRQVELVDGLGLLGRLEQSPLVD